MILRLLLPGIIFNLSNLSALVVPPLSSAPKESTPIGFSEGNSQKELIQNKNLLLSEKESELSVDKIEERLSFIEETVLQYYNVEDLAELGENGKILKEMLNQEIPENAENIQIVENYGKDGKYNLQISYQVKEEELRLQNIITFEGKWNSSVGKLPVVEIIPQKLTFETYALEGAVAGGGIIHQFTFTPKGIEYDMVS